MTKSLAAAAGQPDRQHPSQGRVPASLSDRQLLAALLRPGRERTSANFLATGTLERFGTLGGAVHAALHDPAGLDPGCARLLACAHELVRRQLREELRRGPPLTSPADTVDYLKHALGSRRREIFQCLFLDTRHRVIQNDELFQGSIDGACVYPRVVAERALRYNAAAVIVAHNHPSGVAEPSLADQAITRRLKDALALFEIRLLDHFVIGDGEPVSMAARGMV